MTLRVKVKIVSYQLYNVAFILLPIPIFYPYFITIVFQLDKLIRLKASLLLLILHLLPGQLKILLDSL